MLFKLTAVTFAFLLQCTLIRCQRQWVLPTTTASEMRNPYTWYWPYAIAASEAYRDYFINAQQIHNQLHTQAKITGAFPWASNQANQAANQAGQVPGQVQNGFLGPNNQWGGPGGPGGQNWNGQMNPPNQNWNDQMNQPGQNWNGMEQGGQNWN